MRADLSGWAEVALTEHAGQVAALDGDDPRAWRYAVAGHVDSAARMLGALR
ncbi:hypothetical protein [Micromonospora sp. DT31]|uniref:hypothetical protein n=1 Tax=Micromonospora sp. DT31 TaxID=3393434 RepID=UPI003CF70BF3